ncbi:MAG: Bug family tripartite tricarboxylate transporter substrate binding protein [Xanthobacteraceae bacterium]
MKLLIALAASALLATPAAAQDVASFYKGKTVRIVVGFSAGGGYDHYARVLARHIGRHIPGNPTIIVQNMPGAASLKSVRYLSAGAPTDGTLINAFNPGLITQSLTAPQKISVNFLDFGWLGSITEDFRVCHTWNGTGIKTWQDLLKRPRVNFGVTGVGTASYIYSKMLSDLFGVHVRQVTGYPGSTEKRMAIERGELDGDCIGWTSVPEHWVHEKKVTIHLRFSKRLVLGIPESARVARDILTDERKKHTLDLLTAASLVGRPYIVPKAVPADRLAALRAAFEATMKDKAFIAEIEKQRLTVAPMGAPEVEAFIRQLYKTPADVVADARALSGG